MAVLKVADSPPHEYQDEKYGHKMRVCTKSAKPDTYFDTTTGKVVNHKGVTEEPKKKNK